MTELFVVHKTIPGYAREDPHDSRVLGAYEDEEFANKIAGWIHGRVQRITVGEVPGGYKRFLESLPKH